MKVFDEDGKLVTPYTPSKSPNRELKVMAEYNLSYNISNRLRKLSVAKL